MEKFIEQGILVELPHDRHLQVDPNLPEWRRYCRPWTRQFLLDFGNEYFRKFSGAEKIMITSAVRPKTVQRGLKNPNASPRSTHPTGATIDILYGPLFHQTQRGKQTIYGGMTLEERESAEKYLMEYEAKELVEATKERQQPCYHVMVFKEYKKQEDIRIK